MSEFPAPGQPVPERISIVTWNAEKGGGEQFKPDLARLVIRHADARRRNRESAHGGGIETGPFDEPR